MGDIFAFDHKIPPKLKTKKKGAKIPHDSCKINIRGCGDLGHLNLCIVTPTPK